MKVATVPAERFLAVTLEAAGGQAAAISEQVWLVQATISHVMGVPLNDLCAATRRRPKAALARQIAMYLCHVVFEIGVSEAARAFARDPSTVTHALQRIEEMREDAAFDTTLTAIEAMLLDTWSTTGSTTGAPVGTAVI